MLLVRYGEIGLKGRPVRRQFEQLLLQNIGHALSWAGVEHTAAKKQGRIVVEVEDNGMAIEVLRDVFGIVSISPVVETSADLPSVASAAASFASVIQPGESFAIRATRTGSHDFTSQDVAVAAGQAVVDATGAAVDLNSPDREIGVEVRDSRTFAYHAFVEGPGGLPYGSQGLVAAAVADQDDLQAAWLLMRRGCTTVFVCRPDMEQATREMLQWREADIAIHDGDVLDRAETVAAEQDAAGLVTGQERYQKRRLPLFHPLLGYREVKP